jgi:hypothetical protein
LNVYRFFVFKCIHIHPRIHPHIQRNILVKRMVNGAANNRRPGLPDENSNKDAAYPEEAPSEENNCQ